MPERDSWTRKLKPVVTDNLGAGGNAQYGGRAEANVYVSLAHTMQVHKERRLAALGQGASVFFGATQSRDPWFKTVCVLHGRATDHVMWPWVLINILSFVWTLIFRLLDTDPIDLKAAMSVYPLLMPTLGFLLVFRLNRVAVRFWESRQFWGVMVAIARQIGDLAITHLPDNPMERDRCIAWTCAFLVGVKQLYRGEPADATPSLADQLAGILTTEESEALAAQPHPGLYAAHQIRAAARRGLLEESEDPLEGNGGELLSPTAIRRRSAKTASAFTAICMRSFDECVSNLVLQMGGVERIKATPLPLVYVTHLRTYLTVALGGLPLVFGSTWGWGTIPAVALISYAFLGIEGAAAECDAPFMKGHVNHLNMDAYCMLIMSNMEGILSCVDEEAEIFSTDYGAEFA